MPFLVGFTGHRSVAEAHRPAVRQAIARVLSGLRSAMPATPVALVNGLADGADRLATEVAWELGLPVLAVLPMPRDRYRADFTGESLAWFEAALARCQVVELPWRSTATDDDHLARQAQYEALGSFLTTHSQLLIACWDGAEGLAPGAACKRGGTGDVVHRHLAGALPLDARPAHLLDLEAHGLVAWIATPRTPGAPVRPEPGTVTWRCGEHLAANPVDGPSAQAGRDAGADARQEQAAHARLLLACQRTERLNRDLARLPEAAAIPPAELDPAEPLPGQPGSAPIHPALAPSPTRAFARLDALANRFQTRVMGALPRPGEGSSPAVLLRRIRGAGIAQWVFILAVLGLLLQQGNALAPGSHPLLDVLGTAFLAATYGLVLLSWRTDLHGRFLDYRALAEGMRVACWWRIAGVDEGVAENSFNRQRGQADWNRLVLRALALGPEGSSPGGGAQIDDGARRQLIRTRWFAAQAGYFRQAAARDEWNLKRLRRLGVGLFLASLALVLARVAAGPLGLSVPGAAGPLPFAISAMQFTGAIVLAYVGMLSLAEHAKSYRRMADIYDRALSALDAGADLVVVCRELGREALAENAHWLVVHRQHPIEFGRSAFAVKALTAAQRLRLPGR